MASFDRIVFAAARRIGHGRVHRVIRGVNPTGAAWVLVVLTGLAGSAIAEPYRPSSDDQVLQTLPRVLFAAREKLSSLRSQLADDPENAELAARLARDYLEIGKRESDPRFYGYARAALEPWWGDEDAPPVILKVRAKFKGRNHQFEAALADQYLLLKQKPRDVQAWLEVANLTRLLGQYDQARQACQRLSEFAGPVAVTLCRAPLQALTGHASQAFNKLADLLRSVRNEDPGLVQYIITMQATIAEAIGRLEIAEKRYREGLANKPDNQYLLRAYADFLLDRGRDQEVIALTRGHLRDMGILLRAALAARQGGRRELAEKWERQLANRFEEIHLRGSEPNGRYEARFILGFRNEPRKALSLALANWRNQKEARDARNVLEAALAADDPAAAQPVLDFLNRHGTENVVLNDLMRRIEAKKGKE